MTDRHIFHWPLLLALSSMAVAQDSASQPKSPASAEKTQAEQYDRVPLRVTSADADAIVIDRGSIDGLEPGDLLELAPKGGGRISARVVSTEARSAVVELIVPGALPTPGTRGEARVPSSRFADEEPEPTPTSAPAEPSQPEPQEALPEHPGWSSEDEGYVAGEPLLTRVEAVRPEDRTTQFSGRVYLGTDLIFSDDDGRSTQIYRAGTDLFMENPFGYGGDLRLDFELNHRNLDRPDDGVVEDPFKDTSFRLDRFSYVLGADRFDPDRVAFGRFLHHRMPEFGVIDGVEWTHRFENGHEFGLSTGYLPEPTIDYETGEDLSVSAWYRFIADVDEPLTAAAGYQKSWHNFEADRDLFVFKVDYAPRDAWNARATAWIDYYTAGDDAKGAGIELTEAYALVSRETDGGSSIDFKYTHRLFPEILRYEFQPVEALQLEGDHLDRIAAIIRTPLVDDFVAYTEAGFWDDEDESGFDAEVGAEFNDWLIDDTHAYVGGFTTHGEFSTVVGWRARISRTASLGYWSLGYEWTNQDQNGFNDNNDDIRQQRIRGSRDLFFGSGWSFSAYVDGIIGDSLSGVTAGAFLQRSF